MLLSLHLLEIAPFVLLPLVHLHGGAARVAMQLKRRTTCPE